MKKLELFLYSLYAVGIVFKLFKFPMHTVFILATILALIIYYIVCLIRKSKDSYSILTGFVTVLWLFSLLCILKHFPFQNIAFIIAVLSSAVLLFLGIKNKKLTSVNNMFCLVIISITVLCRTLPSHYTYSLTNIKFNYEIETYYFSWDKYSWFLYKGGKEAEALQANKNAQAAVEKCLQDPKYGDENEYLNYIKEHQLAIESRSWEKYP